MRAHGLNSIESTTGGLTVGNDSISNLNPNRGKNIIINGDFNIWQRGTAFSSTAGSQFTADRMELIVSNDGTESVDRSTTRPTSSQSGHRSNYSVEHSVDVIDSSIGAGQYSALRYQVEGYDFAPVQGETCTLSFWVRAFQTGTYCIAFSNKGIDRSYVVEYTINSSNTWEKKIITVNFNELGGTWDYTDDVGLRIYWAIAIGSTYHTTPGAWQNGFFIATSNQVNGLSNTSNTFYLAQAQFELGDEATDFEYRDIVTELAMCQRYYEDGHIVLRGQAYNISSGLNSTVNFNTEKRSTPTITFTNGSDGGSNSTIGTEGIYPQAFMARAEPTDADVLVYYTCDWAADAEL